MSAGHTLPELLIVLTITGTLTALAAPRVQQARDHAIVRDGVTEIVATLRAARSAAQRRDARAVVAFDTAAAAAMLTVERDTVLVHRFGAELGVTLEASRDTVIYGPSGRGYGSSNTTLIVRRGSAADTVTVSRLGRVKRSH